MATKKKTANAPKKKAPSTAGPRRSTSAKAAKAAKAAKKPQAKATAKAVKKPVKKPAAKPTRAPTQPAPDGAPLTAELHSRFPPRANWKLEVRTDAATGQLGIHLLDGKHRYAVLVKHLSGGAPDADPWALCFQLAKSVYGHLLRSNLMTNDMPSGEVSSADAKFDVRVEHAWAG